MPRAPLPTAVFVVLAAASALGSACGDDYGDGTPAVAPPGDAGVVDADAATGDGAIALDAGTDADEPRLPVPPLSFVVRKVFLGETDRSGVSSSSAWQQYGRDIDGIASTAGAQNGECKRRSGASSGVSADGPNGLDNSFGKNILPLVAALTPNPSENLNGEITKGARTPMLSLDGARGAFLYAEKTLTPPTFAASESRLVAFDWMDGAVPKSRIFKGGATATGDYDSDVLVGVTLALVFASTEGAKPLPIRVPRFRMKISLDGLTATQGTLSGVLSTEELVAEVRRNAGIADADLCQSSTTNAILEQVRQASDIMLDGTQDPTKECDGISIGIGFEATKVVIGNVAGATPPVAEPCAAD